MRIRRGNLLTKTGADGAYVAKLAPTALTTEAVQVALDALAAASFRGVAILPAGTYVGDRTYKVKGSDSTSALVFIPSGITLKGEGAGSTILKLKNGANTSPSGTVALVANAGASGDTDLGLFDLSIDGNSANNNTTPTFGVRFMRAQGITVRNVKIKDNYGGITLNAADEKFCFDAIFCSDVVWDNCRASVTTPVAFASSTGFSANYSTNVSWLNCFATGFQSGMGFAAYSCSTLRYIACVSQKTANKQGFNLELCYDVQYLGCIAGGKAAKTDVGTLTTTENPFVVSQATQGNVNGFVCSGSSVVDYIGCHATYNSQWGFRVEQNQSVTPNVGCDRVRIIGGEASNNTTFGVTIDATTTNYYVDPALMMTGNGSNTSISGSATRMTLSPTYDGLTIGKNSASGVNHILNGAAATTRQVVIQTAGSNRWLIQADGSAESGSNAGSNFAISARDDSGSGLSGGLVITRRNGVVATSAGITTKVKAGTPADADWAVAPADGTIVADSTGTKLWVRLGGAWKSVVVA